MRLALLVAAKTKELDQARAEIQQLRADLARRTETQQQERTTA